MHYGSPSDAHFGISNAHCGIPAFTFEGDGGPATSALLNTPMTLLYEPPLGGLFVSLLESCDAV